MAGVTVYIAGTKATLLDRLRKAVAEIEAQPAEDGAIDVRIYADADQGSISFSNDDMEGRSSEVEGVIYLEVEEE